MPNYKKKPVSGVGIVDTINESLALDSRVFRKLGWRSGRQIQLRVENGRLVAWQESDVSTKEKRS